MPLKVQDVGAFTVTGTSSSTAITSNALGHLDDAQFLTIYFHAATSAGGVFSSAATLQVTMFDPADSTSFVQSGQSTDFFTLSHYSSVGAYNILPVPAGGGALPLNWTGLGFRGIRITGVTMSSNFPSASQIVGRVTKAVVV